MPKPTHAEPVQDSRTRHLRPAALELPPRAAQGRWTMAFKTFTAGLGFFFMGALFDLFLQQHGLGSPALWWGDLLAGVVAGLVVLFYERRRVRELTRRLEIIRLMNHHVRNSLQVISYASSTQDRVAQVDKVRAAIERIDWALREVLPGRVSLSDRDQPQPHKKSLSDLSS
jgi:hypothetical protein